MLAKEISVSHVFRSIDDMLEKATSDFYTAKGQGDTQKAETQADIKLCLAELKLDIVDKIIGM